MNRAIVRLLIYLAVAANMSAAKEMESGAAITPVKTALEHLTVLEYDEPVVQAAVGSSAFEVERQGNKVFLKPLKAGASTNLFVWTAGHHFTYELSVGDPASMDAEIRTAGLQKGPAYPVTANNVQSLTTAEFSETLDNGQAVDSSSIKMANGKVAVRIEEVLQRNKAIIIRYSIENRSDHTYHANSPTLYQVTAEHPRVSLLGLRYKQVKSGILGPIATDSRRQLFVSSSSDAVEIAPGGRKQGSIVVPIDLSSPTVLTLTFDQQVAATMVL